MVDLVQPGRRALQRRVTNNRDGILPGRRNTEAAPVAVRADMRTATRGDGGADELRRVLDGFVNAGARAYDAQTLGNQDLYRRQAAEGAIAAQADTEIDPERARQVAYSEAFYRVRAERRFNDFSNETKTAVEDALNQGADPEEVQALVLERVRAFSSDVMETIPTATAQRATAARLSAMGLELDTEITTRIRERTREEFDVTQAGVIADALTSWGDVAEPPVATPAADAAAGTDGTNPLDVVVTAPAQAAPPPFEEWIANYRAAGFSLTEAKTKVFQAVAAVALNRDDPRPELLERLLDSRQADGRTPSFSAAEQLQINDRLTQARSLEQQVERERREEERDDLVESLALRALDGELDFAPIEEAVRSGVFTPQEGVQFSNLMESLRDAKQGGYVDTAFILDLTQRSVMGNPPSNAQVLQWHREGRFGTGLEAQRAMIQFLADNTSARRAGGGGGSGGDDEGEGGSGDPWMTATQVRNRTVTTARNLLWRGLGVDENSDQGMAEFAVEMDRAFNRRVRAGQDPLTVARALLDAAQPWTSGQRRVIPTPVRQQPYDRDGNPIR